MPCSLHPRGMFTSGAERAPRSVLTLEAIRIVWFCKSSRLSRSHLRKQRKEIRAARYFRGECRFTRSGPDRFGKWASRGRGAVSQLGDATVLRSFARKEWEVVNCKWPGYDELLSVPVMDCGM